MPDDSAACCEQIWHEATLCANSKQRRNVVSSTQLGVIKPVSNVPPQRRSFQPFVRTVQMYDLTSLRFNPEEIFESPKVHEAWRTKSSEGRSWKQHHSTVPFNEVGLGSFLHFEEPNDVIPGYECIAIEEDQDFVSRFTNSCQHRRRGVIQIDRNDSRGAHSCDCLAPVRAGIQDQNEFVRSLTLTIDIGENTLEHARFVMDGENRRDAHFSGQGRSLDLQFRIHGVKHTPGNRVGLHREYRL